MRRLLPDVLILALLFLLPLGFFAPQTLGGQTLVPTENLYQYEPHRTYRDVVRAPDVPANHLISDLILQNYQWKHFVREQLAQGEIPLWNPHQFAGIPFLAAGQHSALYPFGALYYVLDATSAFGWSTVLNLWLAGAMMFCFVRGLGVGRAGALLAGVVYQFNGFLIASVVHQMIIGAVAWLPLLLLMIEYILRQRALLGHASVIPWVALGALAVMLNVLAGHAEITVYTLLIAGYYAAGRLLWAAWRERNTGILLALRGLVQRGLLLLAMVVLGLGLAAVQLIPLVEFVQTNWRTERTDLATVLTYARVPRDVVQFVLPNFYGSPAHQAYFDVFDFERITQWDGTSQPHTEWGIKNYVEAALYMGILPLFLALYALLDRWLFNRRRQMPLGTPDESGANPGPPYRALFALLGVLSLTFMFGLPTYHLLYHVVPGVNQLNTPFRWVYALVLCVAVLAAFGLDALVKQHDKADNPWPRRIGMTLAGSGLLILIALIVSLPLFPVIEPLISNFVEGMVLADRAFNGARMFYSYQFGMVLVLALMLFASGVLFMRLARGRNRLLWQGVAIAVVAADLMLASWGFNVASDPLLLEFEPPVVEWLHAQEAQVGPYRFTTIEDQNQPHILNANMGMMYGLDDIRGYDSIIPGDYVAAMRQLSPQGQLQYNRIAPLFSADNVPLDSVLLDLLNVRYVIGHKTFYVPEADWRVIHEDEAVRVWENADAVPRVFSIRDADFAASWLTDEQRIAAWLGDDLRELQASGLPAYQPQRITRDTGREKFVDVQSADDSWLIISERYDAGWRAFVRERGAGENAESAYEVQRAFGILQAVQLPPGAWTVRLVYSPASFQVGVFGSVISAVAWVLLLGIWFWRAYVGVNDAQSSTTARVARNSVAPIVLNLFNRGIDFAFAIVMLRILPQDAVGVYNFAVVVFVWFDIFTNFGLDAFLIREVSRAKAQSGSYFLNASVLRVLLATLGLPLLLLFMVVWQGTSAEPLPEAGLITLLLLYLGLFPATLSKGMTALFYAHEQAEKPAAIATITSINKAVFGVIVLLLGWGIVGLAAVSIANNILTLVVLLVSGRALIGKILRWRPQRKLLRGMVGESWPLMLNHFLSMVFFQFDIVILQALKGPVVVAQYATSYKWLLAVDIIPAFFTQALFPVMSRQGREDRAALKRTYQLGLKLLVALALPLALGFTFLAEALTLLLAGPRYLPDAAIALQIMIWSIPFGWMNSITQYALIALDLQRYITGAFIGAVAFNIVANLLFIPQFGYQAAALATIASQGALLLPFGLLMQRGLGERINWLGLVWRPLLATGAMLAVMLVGWPVQPLLALTVGSVVYVVLLLALRPLNADERAIVQRLVPGRLRQTRIGRLLLGAPA